ncbi:hypothetical protein SAMN05421825_1614 [Epilithonimonas hungarica]|uniref:Uncharacterized protein n=1 Tax=Epilithonimonas hungarica TaxID=454006 RepID=A0A1G7LWR1_9FLAO|nr:hypothetical protein [Epilithonimonas hungarica]SDF53814.1 hypothetical protein SAMN05421825_1614 [Epilithonimonas hungarica]
MSVFQAFKKTDKFTECSDEAKILKLEISKL